MWRFPLGATLPELPCALWGWPGAPAHPGCGVMLGPLYPPPKDAQSFPWGTGAQGARQALLCSRASITPACHFRLILKAILLYRGRKKKGLFFKAILLNVYMYRQVRE